MMATCGRDELRQRRDFAGMVHADLEHRIFRILPGSAPATAARPSDCCTRRPMHGFRRRRQRKPQRFLVAGLADRTGDRDDLAAQARTPGARQPAQAFKHIVDDQQRRAGKPLALAFRHHRQTAHRLSAQARRSRDRRDCRPGSRRMRRLCRANACLSRCPNPGGHISVAPGIHRGRHCVGRPEHAHATLPCNAVATAS